MQTVHIGKKYIVPLVICLVVAVLLLGIANSASINRQLNAWKLLPQPERLTELYYENHTKLPTTYIPDTPQQFSFTVHNLEYRTISYTYEIIEQAEGAAQSRMLTSGSFSLQQDKYQTTTVSVSPSDLGTRVKIITRLDKSNGTRDKESIHYWIDRSIVEGA